LAIWGFVACSLIGGGMDRWKKGHRLVGGAGVVLGTTILLGLLVRFWPPISP